jgi:hypothetical protein
MKIVAIDPASIVGWASKIDGQVLSGFHKLQGKDLDRVVNYEKFLLKRLPRGALVVYETPIGRRGRLNAFRVGCHLEIMLWLVAGLKNCKLLPLSPPEVKQAAGCKGNANKEEVLEAMADYWNRPDLVDDNEADALAMLKYGIESQEPRRVVRVRARGNL